MSLDSYYKAQEAKKRKRHEEIQKAGGEVKTKQRSSRCPVLNIDPKIVRREVGKYYTRVFVCTHGWKESRQRGEGTVKRQVLRNTGCPATFRPKSTLVQLPMSLEISVSSLLPRSPRTTTR